jgi:hypothetical protein
MATGVGATALLVRLYFVLALNASFRKHRQIWPIFWLNLLVGWTVIGWIAALIWSTSPVARPPSDPSHPE